jgi:hypothetical protein
MGGAPGDSETDEPLGFLPEPGAGNTDMEASADSSGTSSVLFAESVDKESYVAWQKSDGLTESNDFSTSPGKRKSRGKFQVHAVV